MKDLDTKILSEMYDNITGNFSTSNLLLEGSNSQDLEVLGEFASQNLQNTESVNKRAEVIIESIVKTNSDPMISRVLKQCDGASPVEQLKVLHKFMNL